MVTRRYAFLRYLVGGWLLLLCCMPRAAVSASPDEVKVRYVALPFTVLDVSEQSYRNAPALGIRLSSPLDPATDFQQQLAVLRKAADHAELVDGRWQLDENGTRLFFRNIDPQTTYRVVIRDGLTDALGRRLAADFPGETEITTRELASLASFATTGMVLPARLAKGLPVDTVNVAAVDIDFHRIPPEDVPHFLACCASRGSTSAWRLRSEHRARDEGEGDQGEGDEGEGDEGGDAGQGLGAFLNLAYSGRFQLNTERNAKVRNLLPIEGIRALQQPGLYLAVMKTAGRYPESYETTYFFISDLGLHARLFEHSIEVHFSSLSHGQALPAVRAQLLAADGKILAEAESDGTGLVRFVRSSQEPALIFAALGEQSALVDLRAPALDLSEFAQGERNAQEQELFVYGPRDIYRPGETLQLAALLRDADGRLIKALPLPAEIRKPDGSRAAELVLKGDALGFYRNSWEIPADAPLGRWTLHVAGADGQPKEYRFRVEDFLPERLSLELTAPSDAPTIADTSDPLWMEVKGTYLYGAPAANNRVEIQVSVQPDREPFEQWRGFEFGNLKEDPRRTFDKEDGKLDEDGMFNFSMDSEWGTVTSPIQIMAQTSLFDDGGRPVNRVFTQRAWPQASALGIRPASFTPPDPVPANSTAEFEVIHTDHGGRLLAANALEVNLVLEDRSYYWSYSSHDGWRNQFSEKEIVVYSQRLDLGAGQKGHLSVPVEWGQYRLEVRDPEDGSLTSVRFRVGELWWYDEQAPQSEQAAPRPDQVLIQLHKTHYREGVDRIKARFTPPFDGEALITLEADKQLWSLRTHLSTRGTEIEIPLDAAWKRHDLYLVAMVLKPGEQGLKPGPNRAVGLLHLPLERSERRLGLALDAPEKTAPSQPFSVRLKLDRPPAAGEKINVTLAAVDVGVLSLTHFKTPDAFSWFFAPRRYAADMKDLYHRVIENKEGQWASLRFGGDAALNLAGKQPDEDVEILSRFVGPVAFDAQGEASVTFDLPDFNGKMRLMALAYSAERYGMAEQEVTIAAPIVAELGMPRFLAGGDESQLTLAVQNLTEEDQVLAVELAATSPLALKQETRTVRLAPQKKQVLRYATKAQSAFDKARIDLVVRGLREGGVEQSFAREWSLAVRPAYPAETRRVFEQLNAGAKLAPDHAQLTMGLEPLSVQGRLTISPRPPLNLERHLHDLLHYPYGCLEQTASSTHPLTIATPERMRALGLASEALSREELVRRIEVGLKRLSGMQKSNGGFSLWDNQGPEEHWLTAYVADLLLNARDSGFEVSEKLLLRTLTRLEEYLRSDGPMMDERWSTQHTHYTFSYKAYAGYVLSRVNRANLGNLRSLFEHHRQASRTGLPLVHLGLALVAQGDNQRGETALNEALARQPAPWSSYYYYGDYGTVVRDEAMMLALLGKADRLPSGTAQRLFDLAGEINTRPYFSTQERNALLTLGIYYLPKGEAEWRGTLRQGTLGETVTGGTLSRRMDSTAIGEGVDFALETGGPVYARYEVNGYPTEPPTASQPGDRLYISRAYYTTEGEAISSRRFVVGDLVLVGLAIRNRWERMPDLLVVDLLPAGFELENQNLDESIKIDDLVLDGQTIAEHINKNPLKHQEFRSDRYVGALELDRYEDSRHLFYLMRAVTPGRYRLPQPAVEDMYRPGMRALGRNAFDWVEVVSKDTEPEALEDQAAPSQDVGADVAVKPQASLGTGEAPREPEQEAPQRTETSAALVAQMLRLAQQPQANEAIITSLKQRIEANPKPERGNRKVARELNDAALRLLTAKDYTGAVAQLTAASARDNRDVEIRHNLGYALLQAGKLEEAQRILIETLAIQPNRAGAWANLGEAYGAGGKSEEAKAALRHAVRFSGDRDKTIAYLRATSEREGVTPALRDAIQTVLLESGSASNATKEAGPAVASATATGGKETNTALLQQMIRFALQPKADEGAIIVLKQRIEASEKPKRGDRKTARRLNDTGLNQLAAKDYPAAIATLTEASAADQRDVEIRNNLGYALMQAGKLDEAERALLRTLELNPSRAGAWANLGEVYAARGRPEEAKAALRHALRFSGDRDKTIAYLRATSEREGASSTLQHAARTTVNEATAP